jgi:hypothetical protein
MNGGIINDGEVNGTNEDAVAAFSDRLATDDHLIWWMPEQTGFDQPVAPARRGAS